QTVDAGPVGLSPSDVPGSGVTQHDLDGLAERFPGADVWPLTPLQRGLYFQSGLARDEAVDVYVTQAVVHLSGEVDAARLRRAADGLLVQHRALRSVFVRTVSGAVVTVIPPYVTVPWRTVDLTVSEGESIEDAVGGIVRTEKLEPFDLEVAPLLRAVLIRHAEGAHLVITNHHLLYDGWSGPLVMADLLSQYAIGTGYPNQHDPAAGDFGDYARRIGAADTAAGLEAWRELLAAVDEPTLVGTGAEATAEALPQDYRTTLEPDVTAALQDLSRATGATVSTILQGAWAVLLSRLTGNQIVVFGETVSGRPADLPGVESMVGLFINTLPVVVDVDPEISVEQMLRRLQANKVKVLDHQHIGLPELLAMAGRSALFDTLTVYESYPVDTNGVAATASAVAGDGLQILAADVSDATHYPLNLAAAPGSDGIVITFKYLPTVFPETEVRNYSRAFEQILREFVSRSGAATSDVTLISAGEQERLAGVSQGRAVGDPRLLAKIFTTAALHHPHRIAVADDDGQKLTYAELDAASNRIARWLIASGIGAEDLVALAIRRSVHLLTAIWAVTKTGAGYVPVDPEYPADRVTHMVEDSGAVIGLSVEVVAEHFGTDFDWLALSEAGAEIEGYPSSPISDDELLRPVRAENTAYVIYTSGSTGRPKGVAVTHTGLASFADVEVRLAEADADSRVLGFASPSFDASVLEYLLAARSGGALIYRPAETVGGDRLAEYMNANGVTHLFLTPTVLATLDPVQVPSIRCLYVGGEALPQALNDRWAPVHQVRNVYGPTETTIVVMISEAIQRGAPVNLGRPVDGVGIRVLDRCLNPVPFDVPGDLYISGPQLARGYLGRPGRTCSSFVADPHGDSGQQMYKTGDVVRWRTTPEGAAVLEFAGRSDDQVKIRGLRIELGEIESALAAHEVVTAAVVVGVGSPVATGLAAYVTTSDEVSGAALRDHLATRLPSYMVPASIMMLDSLPLTPVGKLDRAALPEPLLQGGEYVSPEGANEEALAGVFAEVLGLDRVGVVDSFFDLGGNSLSAMRLVARASEALAVEVSIRDLFDAPSVRSLVGAVTGNAAALAPIDAAIPRPDRIPLSFAQQRMWFINQLEPGSPVYNIPTVLRVRGGLVVDSLKTALADVVARHEGLRTRFAMDNDGPHQLLDETETIREQLDFTVTDSTTAL
ncbi:MAG: amino acid adenylation domain-containing protein, partial [Rhodococcus sp.]|nr:amino acid adenylation domain-containing protein [Rhodococcus sp. (in: high G+C Gram-positive bacteria)]